MIGNMESCGTDPKAEDEMTAAVSGSKIKVVHLYAALYNTAGFQIFETNPENDQFV